MGARTGLGPAETALLATIAEMGGSGVGRARVDVTDVLGQVGIDASWLRCLLGLARPWATNLHLVDARGHLDFPDHQLDDPDDWPDLDDIRVKLTAIGALAYAAETGPGPHVPIGLIRGDVHGGGSCPPLSPEAVIATLRRVARSPETDDAELLAMIGGPVFPSGCRVSGDLSKLYAGLPSTVGLHARIDVVPGDAPTVIIDRLPPNVSDADVMNSIKERIDTEARREVRLGLPNEVNNLSEPGVERIELTWFMTRARPRPADASAETFAAFAESLGSVHGELLLQYPSPLVGIVRAFVVEAGDDLELGLSALEEAIGHS